MKPSTIQAPDGSALAREIHGRPGIGVSAHVLQGRGLRILRMRVDQSALIFVDRGIKTVKPARGAGVRARAGQALLVSGQQTVDFTNDVTEGEHYEARWLVLDNALLEDAFYRETASRIASVDAPLAPVRLLTRVQTGLTDAFERGRQTLAPDRALPDAVARQRVLEVMHWLLEDGLVLRSASTEADVSVRVRALVAGRLDHDWSAARVAQALAMSEATLRRRLAAEGASMTALIVDARMASALTLLQATTQPVSEIANAVGYDSPSRFAIRFRERFGFAPTVVRGHARAD
ncbi:helix-turn-helix transcriptional regulator [Roseateles chitinivorans]|uniref:helix-turn-helix transcriptional regulator n=1 Tax=Roseateles chitinivorans TaxID=2917965 RepID=UPI003D66F632